MLVNKCDNCKADFDDTNSSTWLQFTAEKGVMIVDGVGNMVKYPVLDFCCPECVKEFMEKSLSQLKEARSKLESEKTST